VDLYNRSQSLCLSYACMLCASVHLFMHDLFGLMHDMFCMMCMICPWLFMLCDEHELMHEMKCMGNLCNECMSMEIRLS
jgi:hypothetical protein